MDPLKVKKLPLKTFWMMQRNIDRLEAGLDYRLMQVMLSVTSSEGVKDHTTRLRQLIGKVVYYDKDRVISVQAQEEKLDIEGLNRLRGKGKLR